MTTTTLYVIIALVGTLVFNMGSANADEGTLKCGNQKWTPEGHTDHNPSNNKFKEMLKEDSFCETVKAIDHMQVKGNIKNWDSFTETKVWQTAGPEAKMCMLEAYDLGDSLADYEMLSCSY